MWWGRTLSPPSAARVIPTWNCGANRLLDDCSIVQNVIDVLTAHGAISTVNSGNTSFRVAAGGFEAVTNPSFVATVRDSRERSGE